MKASSSIDAEKRVSDAYWSCSAEQLFTDFRSAPGGLSSAETQKRLRESGPNVLKPRKRDTALRLFLRQFKNPLILILLFAAGISGFAREWTDGAVILVIVVGSAVITFAQEHRASRAVEKLQSHLVHKVIALRDGKPQSVPASELVAGDVLLLSPGSLIPADGVMLEARDFFVEEAVLTGETFPVEKRPGVADVQAGLAQRLNCVFMGTSVRSGSARALIVRTGGATAFGQIADALSLRPPETEFERGIRLFGFMLLRITLALVLIVFTVNVISAKPPMDSLLFAIALAVGISPEMLPAIITINLSKGAREMAKHGVIVRRLNSIENLGSMDVLCTDKTGTLTEGVVRLKGAFDAQGEPSEDVFRYACWNAGLQTGLVNPIDEAIIAERKFDLADVVKLEEMPYDFIRKRLSIVARQGDQSPLFITKGALDNVLEICGQVRHGGAEAPLDAGRRAAIQERFAQWSLQGFRVLGVAFKSVSVQSSYAREEERDLIFAGFLLFFDPPKPDAKTAIAALAGLGVRLKMITGDNRHVAEHVAESVGVNAKDLLTGADLNRMTDEALLHAVEHTDLFAETDPNQKERLILALKKAGHVVGYMGDGINDAPALHNADVGVSVAGAVDVAREAADFVLLERELDVLRRGIEEGRATFANSIKYIFTTTSANFGNMLSMAGASLFLPFLPLLAKQILLNNFLSDLPALAIAGDNVDREWIAKPRRWDLKFIQKFMLVFGLISSAFDFLAFGALLYVVRATPEQFRTGWFVESLLTELLVVAVMRTRGRFYRSKPGRWLTVSTLGVVAVTLVLPYLPFRALLGFTPLPAKVMAMLLGITFLYLLATETAKGIFYRRVNGGHGSSGTYSPKPEP